MPRRFPEIIGLIKIPEFIEGIPGLENGSDFTGQAGVYSP
jgi:hypothetical protein